MQTSKECEKIENDLATLTQNLVERRDALLESCQHENPVVHIAAGIFDLLACGASLFKTLVAEETRNAKEREAEIRRFQRAKPKE